MSFSNLASRISSLPTIIAGPILRRVEKDSVTVWFASKQALTDVVLEVRDETGSVMFTSPPSATVTLGKKLHVLAITATAESSLLSGGITYLYDIVFGSLSDKRLYSPGILSSTSEDFSADFCYEPFNLPSFRIPSDVSSLKFVHGSCRKPHGGQTDAFRGLDVMIEGHADNSRPEMLMLTGDQIYADDVSDTLLYMLMDASQVLLDWESSEQLPGSPSADQLKPGHRQDTVASDPDDVAAGQLSSGYAKSHLISLGEFYCMYLFAWSNILWPAESDFPVFGDIYEGVEETEEDFLIEAARLVAPEGMVPGGGVRTAEGQTYLDETSGLKAFLKSLRFVRRSMANIPTNMMFDDHEVTDDWFLTREWTEYTLEDNTLSRRILQNGIAAYAVFQGWGNTPSAFQSGEGAALLTLMPSLESETGRLNLTIFVWWPLIREPSGGFRVMTAFRLY